MEIAYEFIKFLAMSLINTFYGHIEITGAERIPKSGPILFAGTHPNALVDPVLVLLSTERIVRFIAKDQLFSLPVLGTILKSVGTIPVKRSVDHGGVHVSNDDMYKKAWEAFEEGESIAIFPEGTTQLTTSIMPLKTGAARIALGYAKETKDQPNSPALKVIPVGLNYMNRNKFRSKVLVCFGLPIGVDEDMMNKYIENPEEAVQEFTNLLQKSLESLTINAPDWVTLRVIQTAKNTHRPPYADTPLEEEVALTRRLLTDYETARKEFDSLPQHVKDKAKDVQQLKSDLTNYQMKLDMLGLSDNDVALSNAKPYRTKNTSQFLFNALILWPVAIFGLLAHMPTAICTSLLGRFLARGEVVEQATYKLMVAVVMTLFCWTVIPGAVAWFKGPMWGLMVLGILPITGYAAVRVRPFTTSVTFIRSMLSAVPKDLQKEREGLKNRVNEVIELEREVFKHE